MVFLVSAGINTFIPLAISIAAYLQGIRLKRNRRFSLLSRFQSNPSSIFWYSVLPILCIAPDYIFDVIFLDSEDENVVMMTQFCTTILYHAWALMSLWAYWPMTKNIEDLRNRESASVSQYLNSTMETTRFL